MTNKRQLKKYIRHACGDMAAELLIARTVFDGFNDNDVNAIINDIAELQVKALEDCTFAFDKARRDFDNAALYNKARAEYNKKAYRTLLGKFHTAMAEIVKKMNAAMPEEFRKANIKK